MGGARHVGGVSSGPGPAPFEGYWYLLRGLKFLGLLGISPQLSQEQLFGAGSEYITCKRNSVSMPGKVTRKEKSDLGGRRGKGRKEKRGEGGREEMVRGREERRERRRRERGREKKEGERKGSREGRKGRGRKGRGGACRLCAEGVHLIKT